MRRLYFLLARVVDGLPNTANTFQVYLAETGSKIIIEQKNRNLKEALANAVAFVKQLMTFYEKYYGLVNTCFSGHSLFKTALDKVSQSINIWLNLNLNIYLLYTYAYIAIVCMLTVCLFSFSSSCCILLAGIPRYHEPRER